MSEIVKLEHVAKIFRRGRLWGSREEIFALRDVTLSVIEGERISIVGESGSGKTTLARIIAGFEKPTHGVVYWFGKKVDELSRSEQTKLRAKIQYVHQDPYSSLNPSRTVYSILADPLRRHYDGDVNERVVELLKLVKLTPPEYFLNKYPYHLSGGMRQRLAIARALTASPNLIIADEPVSMIDMSLRVSVLDVFLDLNRRMNLATVMISHDIALAYYFTMNGGRLCVMYGGRILEEGESDKLITNPLHPYTRLLLLATPQHQREYAELRLNEMKKYFLPELRRIELMEGGSQACPYIARCPFAVDKCREGVELKKVEPRHYVACTRIDELPSWIPLPWFRPKVTTWTG
ncbi:MAG: ATP-binding cassette domain-containing protein [Thermofilaceae archaeon]